MKGRCIIYHSHHFLQYKCPGWVSLGATSLLATGSLLGKCFLEELDTCSDFFFPSGSCSRTSLQPTQCNCRTGRFLQCAIANFCTSQESTNISTKHPISEYISTQQSIFSLWNHLKIIAGILSHEQCSRSIYSVVYNCLCEVLTNYIWFGTQ